ncbi:transposase [Streptomyces sp. NPDC088246]|uniref:transposase n=1 Tax=Streptomyces sp. NPDC088246 TaxID=3365842 RepID=UPI00380DE2C0
MRLRILGVRLGDGVKREGHKSFVVLPAEQERFEPLPATGSVAGVDLGIADFLADSNVGFVANPRHGGRAAARLEAAQQALSRFPRRKAKDRTANRRRAVERVVSRDPGTHGYVYPGVPKAGQARSGCDVGLRPARDRPQMVVADLHVAQLVRIGRRDRSRPLGSSEPPRPPAAAPLPRPGPGFGERTRIRPRSPPPHDTPFTFRRAAGREPGITRPAPGGGRKCGSRRSGSESPPRRPSFGTSLTCALSK